MEFITSVVDFMVSDEVLADDDGFANELFSFVVGIEDGSCKRLDPVHFI